MAVVMAAGPNATDALPAGVTPSQIDERRPLLDGPNRAQYYP